MRSRRPAVNNDNDLGRALSELGPLVEWPTTGDLSVRVARFVAATPQPRRRWASAPVPRLAFALAILMLTVVGGTLAWAPAREAVADRLGLPGIDITSRDTLPPVGGQLELGERVSASDARSQAGFPVAPPPESLGAPTTWLLVHPSGAQVSYVYGQTASLPEVGETGAGLLISQLQGTTNDSFIRKLLDPGSTLEVVDTGGSAGFWIAGEPHGFMYVAPDGTFHEERIRLAGNVLIWTRGDVTYRIESALPLDRVLEIARELRAPG